MKVYTEANFDELSWHDCHVHGINLLTGDPAENDWTSVLELDLDFIAHWACSPDGPARFHVAPATLAFSGVTDLQIQIDWGSSTNLVALHAASLDRIEREPVVDQKIHLDGPYYAWTLRFNWPDGGIIRCGAVGFTLQLRSQPIELTSQHLSSNQRRT